MPTVNFPNSSDIWLGSTPILIPSLHENSVGFPLAVKIQTKILTLTHKAFPVDPGPAPGSCPSTSPVLRCVSLGSLDEPCSLPAWAGRALCPQCLLLKCALQFLLSSLISSFVFQILSLSWGSLLGSQSWLSFLHYILLLNWVPFLCSSSSIWIRLICVWFFLSGPHQSISSMEERSILLTMAATVPVIGHTSSTYLLSGRIENWLVSICCYLIHSEKGSWPLQISDLGLAGFWVWAEDCTSRSERKRREASGCLPPDLGADYSS